MWNTAEEGNKVTEIQLHEGASGGCCEKGRERNGNEEESLGKEEKKLDENEDRVG